MTDVFIILSDAELDQISGGALHMPQPPTPGHNPWQGHHDDEGVLKPPIVQASPHALFQFAP
jgi:bacteriocin-like protein